MEIYYLINRKKCAIVTTSPPDLLEHIAREAHHLWRNLEGRDYYLRDRA